jgi:hypothetical protein
VACNRVRVVLPSSRLNLNIIVGPEKPGHIKPILSGHLPILIPILIDYRDSRLYGPGTSLAAPFGACVPHLDIVIACARSPLEGGVSSPSESPSGRPIISFPYWRALSFAFHMAMNRTSLPHFSGDQINQIYVFDALDCAALPSHPYPALTHLTLKVTSNAAVLDSSQGSFLLACLQGMQCLRSLYLTTPNDLRDSHPSIQLPNTLSHLSY